MTAMYKSLWELSEIWQKHSFSIVVNFVASFRQYYIIKNMSKLIHLRNWQSPSSLYLLKRIELNWQSITMDKIEMNGINLLDNLSYGEDDYTLDTKHIPYPSEQLRYECFHFHLFKFWSWIFCLFCSFSLRRTPCVGPQVILSNFLISNCGHLRIYKPTRWTIFSFSRWGSPFFHKYRCSSEDY